MFIGTVIGSVVSTIKHPVYEGRKVLLVQLKSPVGDAKPVTVVAVDAVHAGIGDRVLVASGGGAAADVLGLGRQVPLRSVVVGVIDSVNIARRPSPVTNAEKTK